MYHVICLTYYILYTVYYMLHTTCDILNSLYYIRYICTICMIYYIGFTIHYIPRGVHCSIIYCDVRHYTISQASRSEAAVSQRLASLSYLPVAGAWRHGNLRQHS